MFLLTMPTGVAGRSRNLMSVPKSGTTAYHSFKRRPDGVAHAAF
jgi:hypothetical protein